MSKYLLGSLFKQYHSIYFRVSSSTHSDIQFKEVVTAKQPGAGGKLCDSEMLG